VVRALQGHRRSDGAQQSGWNGGRGGRHRQTAVESGMTGSSIEGDGVVYRNVTRSGRGMATPRLPLARSSRTRRKAPVVLLRNRPQVPQTSGTDQAKTHSSACTSSASRMHLSLPCGPSALLTAGVVPLRVDSRTLAPAHRPPSPSRRVGRGLFALLEAPCAARRGRGSRRGCRTAPVVLQAQSVRVDDGCQNRAGA
jgi:hypothetical protein